MTEAIIVALITGGLAFAGNFINNNKKQAVIEYKIEELTREVREHNNFAKRMPVVENEIANIKDQIKQD